MKHIILNKDADRRIKAGHNWIFSNDINTQITPLKNFSAGEYVLVKTAAQSPLAIGHINPHCLLCIRVLSRDAAEKIDVSFFEKKLLAAKAKRDFIFHTPFYRLVFGDADDLSGLVIDRFSDVFVIQLNSAGMENAKAEIIAALKNTMHPAVIVLKCDSSERQLEGLENDCETVLGNAPDFLSVTENNIDFETPLISAQKTGWFYDHRMNRTRIKTYCNQKNVLDVFSYCGGFSIPCKKAGALSVTAIDRSEIALDYLKRNAEKNHCHINTICDDAVHAMGKLIADKKQFDVVILDPPALIKRKKDQEAGEKMYQRLNTLAMQLVKKPGILLSASCSMHLSRDALLNTIRKSALQTNNTVSVLEQLHQDADHPVHPAMHETNYLKGFILSVF